MLTPTRVQTGALCLALLATAACGGSPTRPSDVSGATVAGTVYSGAGATKGMHALSGTPAAGLTVSVVGTALSATVESSGNFQLSGVPAGTVRLQFRDSNVNATTELSNIKAEQLVEIQVEVSGGTATVVSEERSEAKVSLCHRTESGTYHMITVSNTAEATHRAHGDAKVGEQVPGLAATQVLDQNCRVVGPAVQITKSTNGEDANEAPGPTITVGNTVTWEYVIANTGTVDLTNVLVVDDRNVAVTCPATTLAAGQTMTCSGSGVAVAGQYKNVGTVTANSVSGSVTDSDPSHYFGRAPEPEEEDEGPKVQLCHALGNGRYNLIEVSVSAEPAHRAHGDGKIGESVPGSAGKVFGSGCEVK